VPAVSLGTFMENITRCAEKSDLDGSGDFQLGTCVECDDENILKCKEEARAKQIADLVEQNTQWHWSYVIMTFSSVCAYSTKD
jgi:hypothetical protein